MNKTPNQENVSNSPAVQDQNAKEVTAFYGCETLGEALWKIYEPKMERTRGDLSPEVYEAIWQSVRRKCSPWPVWVLKVAAEVLHVQFPTIPTTTIEEALRFFHFIVLEAKIDGSSKDRMPKMPDLTPAIVGALAGSVLAHIVWFPKEIEKAKNLLPVERLEHYKKQFQPEEAQLKLAVAVGDYFKVRPENLIIFNEAFAQASSKTFDKDGNRKETDATVLYEQILSDWPIIEKLSGQKALTEYLLPHLPDHGYELPEDIVAENLERIKKVCQRMQITFKPMSRDT